MSNIFFAQVPRGVSLSCTLKRRLLGPEDCLIEAI